MSLIFPVHTKIFMKKSEKKKEKEPQMFFNSFKSGPDFSRDRTYTVLALIKKVPGFELRASGL